MFYEVKNYSRKQLIWLIILRMAIGWRFLYEGYVKLSNPNWSAESYLANAKGFLSGIFSSMAANPDIVNVVNFLNQWGLFLIGLGLILGVFTKIASYAGLLLLAMYYLAYPPFIGIEFQLPPEGSYLIVNKTLIEFFAMVMMIIFPTSQIIGMDRFIFARKK